MYYLFHVEVDSAIIFEVQVQVVLALMHYLFHVEVGHSATHTHLLRNRVHQFHASFFTSHVVIYKLLNRRFTDPSGAGASPCLVDLS